jgi:hypothetical protein
MGAETVVEADALTPAQRIGLERKVKEAVASPPPEPMKRTRGKAGTWKEKV